MDVQRVSYKDKAEAVGFPYDQLATVLGVSKDALRTTQVAVLLVHRWMIIEVLVEANGDYRDLTCLPDLQGHWSLASVRRDATLCASCWHIPWMKSRASRKLDYRFDF